MAADYTECGECGAQVLLPHSEAADYERGKAEGFAAGVEAAARKIEADDLRWTTPEAVARSASPGGFVGLTVEDFAQFINLVELKYGNRDPDVSTFVARQRAALAAHKGGG